MLSPTIVGSLEKLFAKGQSELDFECGSISCSHGVLGLLAWQDRKVRLHEDCTVIVLHSTRTFARENLHAARESRQTPEERGISAMTAAFASQLQVPEHMLQAAVLDSKVIHWHQGQVQICISGDRDCLV